MSNTMTARDFIKRLFDLNAKAAGWNGMNSRISEAAPGGSSANDLVNKLRAAAVTYGQLIHDHASAEALQEAADAVEGYLQTMAVLEQLSSTEADSLIDALHDVTAAHN